MALYCSLSSHVRRVTVPKAEGNRVALCYNKQALEVKEIRQIISSFANFKNLMYSMLRHYDFGG